MANPEHLKILKQGVEVWNQWRRENLILNLEDGKYVFSKTELKRAEFSRRELSRLGLSGLSGLSLVSPDLTGAKLSEVDLARADLSRGKLGGADLRGANLRRAGLSGADLTKADLTGADLSEAWLKGANFTGANLSAASLAAALLLETVFGDTLLKDTKGLAECRFDGPSTIDNRTLAKSWPLPESFLRGCGLTDDFIEYIPSLLGKPFEFYSCFISYSNSDEDFAERLHADLQDSGVRCWFAPEDIKIGDRIRPRLDESIRLYDKLLLILSQTSLASQWIEQEVESALEKERREGTTVLFPIRLDDAVMDAEGGWPQLIRNTRHIGDFTNWNDHDAYRKAFERLLRDLKAEEMRTN